MVRRIFLFIVAVVILQLSFSGPATAQISSSCLSIISWYPLLEGPYPPGYSFYGLGPGAYAVEIASWTANCPPAIASLETHSDCPLCSKPISLATGNTSITQSDVSIPGLGGGLKLVRRWNSIWPATQAADSVGLFGPNWRSTYEERVFLGNDGTYKYARADGSYWSFATGQSPARLLAPPNVVATLASGSTYWTITFQDGEQRRFSNATGALIAIIDRNGNTTQIKYDGNNRLQYIIDPFSRTLTFQYANGSSRLVSMVTTSIGTTDIGISVRYQYDTQNRLSVVTLQDSSTLAFTYDPSFPALITSVNDSQNKVLESHTYYSDGKGKTASQANGVNAVTITYP